MRYAGEQHLEGDATGAQEITYQPGVSLVRVTPEGGDVYYSGGGTPTVGGTGRFVLGDGKERLFFENYALLDWHIPVGVTLHVELLSEFNR